MGEKKRREKERRKEGTRKEAESGFYNTQIRSVSTGSTDKGLLVQKMAGVLFTGELPEGMGRKQTLGTEHSWRFHYKYEH